MAPDLFSARLRGCQTAYAYMVGALGHALDGWEHASPGDRVVHGGDKRCA